MNSDIPRVSIARVSSSMNKNQLGPEVPGIMCLLENTPCGLEYPSVLFVSLPVVVILPLLLGLLKDVDAMFPPLLSSDGVGVGPGGGPGSFLLVK